MTTSPLVSTAAAAAAVVPFHCVICFEEFSLTRRFPVVLPCGHTYVCSPCAHRLKRCMECREPLFLNASPKPTATTSGGTGGTCTINRGRAPLYPQGRYHQAPSSPVSTLAQSHQYHPDPIALPLPKNIVLMSMMEAACSQILRGKSTPNNEHETINTELQQINEKEDDADSDNDEDEFDLNRIISGMVTFSGPCGTYVVRDPNGLTVLPNYPDGVEHTTNCNPPDDEAATTNKNNKDSDQTNNKPFKIFQGQTVQIVTFSNGVAKLARGAGCIVAASSQLAKVGAPLDTCCRLEGVVETLALRGKDLQAALTENEEIESRLREQVEEERQHEPIHPVIADGLKAHEDEAEKARPNKNERHKAGSGDDVNSFEHPLLMPDSPREVFVAEASDSSGLELVGEERLLLYAGSVSRVPSSPNSIDNSELNRLETNAPGMPRYRRNSDDDLNELTYGCGSALFGKAFMNFEQGLSFDSLDSVQQPVSQPRRLENSSGENYGSASSPARPLQNHTHVTNFMSAATPVLSSSFDTVDWRTGMSGHRGLSKTSPRSNSISRSVRMMSEHRGIGSIRAASSRHSNSPSSSPALAPRFASPNEHDDHIN